MPGSTGSHSRRSPSPGFVTNPFTLTEEHERHSDSLSIITVKENNRIFCPVCYDIIAADDVSRVEDCHYYPYITNLFDALDQHGSREQLRELILPILEILLRHRKLKVKNDADLHDMSRIIYKTTKHNSSDLEEFSRLVRILSSISIENLDPIPLKSIWDSWKLLLEHGQSNLPPINTDYSFSQACVRFYHSLFTIINTYLALINSHSEDHMSDLVFPILRDTKDVISLRYYIDSQSECLDIMKNSLVPGCSFHISNADKLNDLETDLLAEIFDALLESLKAAIRTKNHDYIGWLRDMDYIYRIHSLFYKNPRIVCRNKIERFLKELVLYEIENDYGSDEIVQRYVRDEAKIVLSARVVRAIENYEEKFKAYGFYLLVNCAAIKQNSEYLFLNRIKSVISEESEIMSRVRADFRSSRTMMRSQALVTAIVTDGPYGDNAAKKYIRKVWRELEGANDIKSFNEIFCFEEAVFEWAHRHHEFAGLMNLDGLKYVIENSSKRGNLNRSLTKLLSGGYRHLVGKQIRQNHKGLLRQIMTLEPNEMDDNLLNDLAGLVSTLSQESILRTLHDRSSTVSLRNIQEELSTMSLLLRRYPKFDPYLDHRYVIDFARFVENIFQSFHLSNTKRRILIAAHDFMADLIKSNHSCVNKLIQQIDFTLLGYMYSNLENRRVSNELIEAIAEVLIAYDDMDYPFEHRLDRSLYLMVDSALDWTLSQSRNLHLLALKLLEKIFSHSNSIELTNLQKNYLTTGLIHMLFNDQELVSNHKKSVFSLMNFDEVRYNPLCKHLIHKTPLLAQHYENFPCMEIPMSPDLTFESVDEDFHDEDLSISRIIDQLSDESMIKDMASPFPKGVYISFSTLSQDDTQMSTSLSTQDWEKRAYEASQSIHFNTD